MAAVLVEGRLGTVYVLAGAWSILLLVTNPLGEHGLLDMLKGEIIAVSNADLGQTAVVFAVVACALFAFQKEFLLVSFDREMAVTLKKSAAFWDGFLFLLVGLTISMAVLSAGPLVAFGFLLIPPLIAHLLAHNMRQFTLIASGTGGLSALAGFYFAYRWDLPVGPTDVALLGIVYGLVFLGAKADFDAFSETARHAKVHRSPVISPYRQLDSQRIVQTIDALQKRIEERFPGSGLSKLVSDLQQAAIETLSRTAWIQKPHLPLRIGVWTLTVAIVALFLYILLSYRELQVRELSSFLQALDAGISSIVYIGAAIIFLVSWETRIKRDRALGALHELRAMAHIVDMHQLTKDPERAFRIGMNTASSPKHLLTPFELSRYLDYCSEALSLISKIAALYVQGFQDAVVLDSVDDLEDLTIGMSRKIWQKITLIDLMQRSSENSETPAID